MKEQIRAVLLTAVSLALCSVLMCSLALMPYRAQPQATTSVSTAATTTTTSAATTTVTTTTTVAQTQATTIPTTVTVPTVPATTVPVTTVPVTTVPPATTVPVTTVPPATVPPTTVPVTTVPVTTVPPTTAPVVTVPAIPTPSAVLSARNAFVYDCSTDTLLCAKGAMTDRLHPASITKLFTVYIALQYLAPERSITVGTILDSVPLDASVADLQIGDVLTTEQLIAAMLLPSGNDAAMVLAVEAGRVITQDPDLTETAALAAFVAEMNRQADTLGLQNSHFTCPDGYADMEHYTCMADLLIITRLCIRIPLVCQLTATPKYTLTLENGRTFTWTNTNWLVREDKTDYYNPYCLGLKTGFMNAAGYCLMSYFQVEGQDLIIGLFGSDSIQNRFDDTLKLFDEFA